MRNPPGTLALAALVALVSGDSEGQGPAASEPLAVRETHVATLPDRRLERIEVGPGGGRVVCVLGSMPLFGRMSQWLVADGQEGREYDQIENIAFSPDGKRFACTARRRDRASVVVTDGGEQAPYALIAAPLFSPDGRLTYAARRGSQWFAVLDGQEGPPYDAIGTLVFSAQGGRLAYTARRGKRAVLVSDGREVGEYDSLDVPTFSRDGTRLAVRAKRGKDAFVVVDGRESPPYRETGAYVFTPDGRHLAFVGRDDAAHVVVDGKSVRAYDEVNALFASAEGGHVAVCARQGRKWRMVVDDREAPEYDDVVCTASPFSPDGGRVAYFARRGRQWLVAFDGSETPAFDDVGSRSSPFSPDGVHSIWKGIAPTFSPDGSRLAFAAKKGERWVVRADRQESKEYDEVVGDTLTFSPDGRRLAYRARRGPKWLVVTDGREGPEYDDLVGNERPGRFARLDPQPPVFSPDGRWVAYPARRGKRWVVAAGERETRGYDLVLASSLAFDGPRRLRALALEENRLLRLEITLD
jgi:hypothetical protein